MSDRVTFEVWDKQIAEYFPASELLEFFERIGHKRLRRFMHGYLGPVTPWLAIDWLGHIEGVVGGFVDGELKFVLALSQSGGMNLVAHQVSDRVDDKEIRVELAEGAIFTAFQAFNVFNLVGMTPKRFKYAVLAAKEFGFRELCVVPDASFMGNGLEDMVMTILSLEEVANNGRWRRWYRRDHQWNIWRGQQHREVQCREGTGTTGSSTEGGSCEEGATGGCEESSSSGA